MLPACTCEGTASSGLALIPSMRGTSHEKACHAERSTVQLRDYAAARNDPCREEFARSEEWYQPRAARYLSCIANVCADIELCTISTPSEGNNDMATGRRVDLRAQQHVLPHQRTAWPSEGTHHGSTHQIALHANEVPSPALPMLALFLSSSAPTRSSKQMGHEAAG